MSKISGTFLFGELATNGDERNIPIPYSSGAAIGIVVAEIYQSPLAQLISGVLQAVAGGTFLYVTFFEVLPHEMNSGGDRLIKVLAIILGFSFIAAMMILLPHA